MPRAMKSQVDAVRFGALIKNLRLQRGWTLKKFARIADMHPTYLGILERGFNIPSLVCILNLAEVFGVDPGELVQQVANARKPAVARAVMPPEPVNDGR